MDNGTSAECIGVVADGGEAQALKLPVKKELSYTKEVRHITRVDCPALIKLFECLIITDNVYVVGLERPMINSTRFNASLSAIRALEATLIALEATELRYEYIDSKTWQNVMLPKGIKGSEELKKASGDVGRRLFPKLKIKKDADSLLIAEYLRRRNNREL